MTKNIQREQARQLRQEKGLSIIEIAEKIGVAKSSVSTWVRYVKVMFIISLSAVSKKGAS